MRWCDCGRPGCESRGFSAESSKHGCKIGSDCRWSARTGKSSVRLGERGHPIRQLDKRPISKTQNHRGIMLPKISPCLWFDHQAEDAARFYIAIFKDSKILAISRYPEAGQEIHGKPAGSVMTVAFELNGQSFTALNGGPVFKFNEAVSLQIECATQEEVDYYWERLSEGGDPQAQQCGWLKDKFGLSWQIVPKVLPELLNDPDTAKSQRAFQAMMQMKKLDIERLQCAFAG